MSFAEKVIQFNRETIYSGELPEGISVMNPYLDSREAFNVSSAFYRKYYNDNNARKLILGINPGRHGAGITGVPFTDTIRMEAACGIPVSGFRSHELYGR